MTSIHRVFFGFLTLAIIILSSYSPAHGWAKTGHRVVAEIGENHLSPKAASEISILLGSADLAEIANFPDYSLSSPDPFWRGESAPWHYVTVDDDKTYREMGPPEEGDAITALEKYSKILKDRNQNLEDRKLALIFIVHLVGDLHQPMHAGNGTDRGGNLVEMVFFDEVTNRHKVWDEGIIDFEELSYTELSNWLNRKITPAQKQAWKELDPIVWAEESIAIRKAVYAEDVRFAKYKYIYAHRDTVRERLSQGGIRLAHYLNALLD